LNTLIDSPESLRDYIVALVETLRAAEPGAGLRMRQAAGNRRARITLDDEVVDLQFVGEELVVASPDPNSAVDGYGATDTATVLALLDGIMEVSDAILDSHLQVTGLAQDIARMFTAIEILLDATPRVPELRALADRFRAQRLDRREHTAPGSGTAPWYPFRSSTREVDLLSKLRLL
jgi:hypothetical protein